MTLPNPYITGALAYARFAANPNPPKLRQYVYPAPLQIAHIHAYKAELRAGRVQAVAK